MNNQPRIPLQPLDSVDVHSAMVHNHHHSSSSSSITTTTFSSSSTTATCSSTSPPLSEMNPQQMTDAVLSLTSNTNAAADMKPSDSSTTTLTHSSSSAYLSSNSPTTTPAALGGGGLRHPMRRKTRGKQKIPIEFMQDKMRRTSCFAKRKQGLMKKAYEISELTGAEVLVLIASPTDHVYTFHTPKFRSLIESPAAKSQIEACIRGESSCNSGGGSGVDGMDTSTLPPGSVGVSSHHHHHHHAVGGDNDSVFGVEGTIHFGHLHNASSP